MKYHPGLLEKYVPRKLSITERLNQNVTVYFAEKFLVQYMITNVFAESTNVWNTEELPAKNVV